MEKDIVERLHAAEVEYEPAGVWEEERLNALFQEAAGEIEKLRCLCQHWEIKYARMKADYIDLVESGKLRPYVSDAVSKEH